MVNIIVKIKYNGQKIHNRNILQILKNEAKGFKNF